MIFSLNTALIPIAKKVLDDTKPVSYSWGNIDALHKWIEDMNKKQVHKSLGIDGGRKYPLIWLAEGWVAKEYFSGVKFTNVNFYISSNSKIESLNENRVPNFENLYKVANDFIKELNQYGRIEENNISYKERASFNTVVADSNEKKSITSDIWDTLIVSLDLAVYSDC